MSLHTVQRYPMKLSARWYLDLFIPPLLFLLMGRWEFKKNVQEEFDAWDVVWQLVLPD